VKGSRVAAGNQKFSVAVWITLTHMGGLVLSIGLPTFFSLAEYRVSGTFVEIN
jgi:hypothetical protein